jgi:hypothetical protein
MGLVSTFDMAASGGPLLPAAGAETSMKHWSKENWQGKPEYSEKTCPSDGTRAPQWEVGE